jgi:hypothetical protein
MERQVTQSLNKKISDIKEAMEGDSDCIIFPKENQHYLAS